MSLFNEVEFYADPDTLEPDGVGVEKYLRKRKYADQRKKLVKNILYNKVLYNMDESE